MNTNKLIEQVARAAFDFNGGNPHMARLVNAPGRYLRIDVTAMEATAAKLYLSTTMEACRHAVAEDLRAQRTWIVARLLCKGVHTDIRYPVRATDSGIEDITHRYVTSKEGLLESLRHHRPRKPLPVSLEDKATVFREIELTTVDSDEENYAEWSAPARVVASLNAFLKRYGFTPLDTPAGAQLLNELDELLLTGKASADWATVPISQVYADNGNAPYASCMRGNAAEMFELYDYMQRHGQLKLMELTRDGAHIGRALVWFGSNPDSVYLDRIYSPDARGNFEVDVTKAVREFCETNGIHKTVFEQTHCRFPELELTKRLRLKLKGNKRPGSFDTYPYVDSLRYFHKDGWLATYSRSGYDCIILDNTDGGYTNPEDDEDGDGYVTLADAPALN